MLAQHRGQGVADVGCPAVVVGKDDRVRGSGAGSDATPQGGPFCLGGRRWVAARQRGQPPAVGAPASPPPSPKAICSVLRAWRLWTPAEKRDPSATGPASGELRHRHSPLADVLAAHVIQARHRSHADLPGGYRLGLRSQEASRPLIATLFTVSPTGPARLCIARSSLGTAIPQRPPALGGRLPAAHFRHPRPTARPAGCSGSDPRKRGEPTVGVPLPAADHGFRDTSASARESGISRVRK